MFREFQTPVSMEIARDIREERPHRTDEVTLEEKEGLDDAGEGDSKHQYKKVGSSRRLEAL